MLLFSAGLSCLALVVGLGVSRIQAVSITASDLPECAVECYVNAGAKVAIPITDYEGQCRSGEFQVTLRQCAENTCNKEEYEFVTDVCGTIIDSRRSFMRNSIVRSLESISIMCSRSIRRLVLRNRRSRPREMEHLHQMVRQVRLLDPVPVRFARLPRLLQPE